MNIAQLAQPYLPAVASITDDLERNNRICEIAFDMKRKMKANSAFLIEFGTTLERLSTPKH